MRVRQRRSNRTGGDGIEGATRWVIGVGGSAPVCVGKRGISACGEEGLQDGRVTHHGGCVQRSDAAHTDEVNIEAWVGDERFHQFLAVVKQKRERWRGERNGWKEKVVANGG